MRDDIQGVNPDGQNAALPEKPSLPTVIRLVGGVAIQPNEIERVSGNGAYSYLHDLEGNSIRVTMLISKIAALLGVAFVRVHKSHLVQVSQIAKFSATHIRLKSGKLVPVGEQYKAKIRELYTPPSSDSSSMPD